MAIGDGRYATIAEVKAYKGINGQAANLTGVSDTEIGNKIAEVENLVESITSQIFYALTATYIFDGNGKDLLFFPPTVLYPCISITSVQALDFDGTTVLDTYVENVDFKKNPHSIELEKEVDTARRLIKLGFGWPRGQRNIKVVGTWGETNATAVAEIKRAVLLLVIAEFDPGILNMATRDVREASWSDFRVTFRNLQDKEPIYTGVPEVDRILHRNVNHAGLFTVVG